MIPRSSLVRVPLLFLGVLLVTNPLSAAVSVVVKPDTASLRPGVSQAFSSTVSGTTDLRVKWYVNGVEGGNATLGLVSTTGTYTAPLVAPAAPVTIKAVSVADPTQSDSSTVSFLTPIPILTDVQPHYINTGLTTTIRAYGSKFISGATIYWGAVALPTTFVSATELDASYSPSETAGTAISVWVKNPNPGAVYSAVSQNVVVVPPIVVVIGPATATLRLGASLQFPSYVGYAQNSALKWYVNGIAGGNSSIGTVATDGTYTTPATLPASSVVTIKAASVQDPRAFGTSTVTLLNAIPSFTDVQPRFPNTGLVMTLHAYGSGFVSGAQIYWGANPLTTTFVSSTELRATYTSADVAGSEISLVVKNPSSGGAASQPQDVLIQPPIGVTVSPPAATLRLGATVQIQSAVQNSQNQTVNWTVNGVVGGNATIGTISAQGFYSSPAVLPTSNVITIKAASVQDSRATATASVTLLNALPVVSGVTPPTLTTATTSFVINGTGFARATTATLDGQPLQLTFVSPTQLSVTGVALGLQLGGFSVLKLNNPDPGGSSAQPTGIPVTVPSSVMSYSLASRFLEQASWGPTPTSVGHLMQVGRDAWLNEQLVAPPSTYTDNIGTMPGLSSLQSQFMLNAMQGSDQLRQRMAFALSQIVVVSGQKLESHSQMAPYQRLLLAYSFGNFRDLLREVTLSPSMGDYLDMANNDKPNPYVAMLPNENYARELLQLFSIGPGFYTETDIKQLALSLTGWTYPPAPGAASVWPNPAYYTGQMVAFESHHDQTAKRVLGVSIPAGQTARQNLDTVLDIVFNHPTLPRFVSYRLIQRLVTGNPSPAYVGRVAAIFANNGQGVRGDLWSVVRAILLDPEAATDGVTTLAADQGHLREPVLYLTTLLRGLGATLPPDTHIADFAGIMGQSLFYPPSVFNYFSPSYPIPGFGIPGPEFQILSGATALNRANVALLAAYGSLSSYVTMPLDHFDDLAWNVPVLLDAISNALLRGDMQPDMRASITTAIGGLSDPFARARTALYLVATHARFQSQR